MTNFDALIHDIVIPNLILFISNVTATSDHYTLSLHDALPIFLIARSLAPELVGPEDIVELDLDAQPVRGDGRSLRSEEHTPELQSHVRLVCRPLLEKKAEDTLPLGIAQVTKLRPLINSGSCIG